jgi:hypothetical protein
LTYGAIADQFDAGFVQSRNELGKGFDIAANDAFTGLHPLDCGQGKTGKFRELALVYSDQRARSPELSSGYHVLNIESEI